MRGEKINIPKRDLNKYLFNFVKDKLNLSNEKWKFKFDPAMDYFRIRSRGEYGEKRISVTWMDYSNSTEIEINWLNHLMYEIEQRNGFEIVYHPNNPKISREPYTITTAIRAYGPFNSRFNVRDSVYPSRNQCILARNNGTPIYGYHLDLEYEEDLEHILDFLNGYIEKVALPFLETCLSLQKINDEIIDWYPVGKMNRHFPLHHNRLKLLIMGLCENPNYDAEWNAMLKRHTPEFLSTDRGQSSIKMYQDIDKLVRSKEKERYEQYL